MNETTRTYDVIVIGAGPVGENVAERARAAGLSTVIVERELIGGECSFWACDPSKALLRPVVARADARRIPGLNPAVAGPLDVEAVLAHRDKMSSYWKDEDQVDWLDSVNVDLIRGHGRLTGPKQVAVQTPDGETIALTARHAVAVSTGTRAALPPIPGLDTVRPWTSREATSADKVPGRLAVVGGGVVAVEMATAWQALGSQVTMLVLEDGLLQRMEPFAGELVTDGLREAGVDIRFGTSVTSLAREDGEVQITLADGGHLAADEILLATGRAPNTWDLGLETIGLTPGDWLKVDDTFRVTDVADGWFYAVAADPLEHRAGHLPEVQPPQRRRGKEGEQERGDDLEAQPRRRGGGARQHDALPERDDHEQLEALAEMGALDLPLAHRGGSDTRQPIRRERRRQIESESTEPQNPAQRFGIDDAARDPQWR